MSAISNGIFPIALQWEKVEHFQSFCNGQNQNIASHFAMDYKIQIIYFYPFITYHPLRADSLYVS